MDTFVINLAINKGLENELREISKIIDYDENDGKFKNLDTAIYDFIKSKGDNIAILHYILYLIYDIDENKLLPIIEEEYIIGKKSDEILQKYKEIRERVKGQEIGIKNEFYRKVLEMKEEDFEALVKICKHISNIYDQIYSDMPEIQNIKKEIEEWKLKDASDIFDYTKASKVNPKMILWVFVALIVIAFVVLGTISFFMLEKSIHVPKPIHTSKINIPETHSHSSKIQSNIPEAHITNPKIQVNIPESHSHSSKIQSNIPEAHITNQKVNIPKKHISDNEIHEYHHRENKNKTNTSKTNIPKVHNYSDKNKTY